jgi:hypothetical protein
VRYFIPETVPGMTSDPVAGRAQEVGVGDSVVIVVRTVAGVLVPVTGIVAVWGVPDDVTVGVPGCVVARGVIHPAIQTMMTQTMKKSPND